MLSEDFVIATGVQHTVREFPMWARARNSPFANSRSLK